MGETTSAFKIKNITDEVNILFPERDKSNKGVFIVKSGNQWLVDASKKPKPVSLFMDIWFEDEVCIFFADTNVGKSILAVMIAIEIAATQKVLYIDFELSDKQFEARYSQDYTNHYCFPENFYRAEINPDKVDYQEAGFTNIEEYINASIKDAVVSIGAKVVIIDNLTYLRTETEKSKEALPLMKNLKALKKELGLSILALAHTPKRNMAMPITRNDLGGSKMLMNFCDSSFAIGESAKDKSLRYLKQIKYRATAVKYDSDNVAVFELMKQVNFLMFKPVQGVHGVHTTHEHEHLKQYTQKDKNDIINNINSLITEGKSYRDISTILGISIGTVSNYRKECSS